MKNAVIIGLGNIGYRHFQGISKLKNKIYLIDPYIKKKELKKFNISKKVFFLKDYIYLPKKIDLAIISCSANERLSCLLKLIKNTKVKNIILEKVLFNKLDDYKKIKFLHKKNINIWVNANMRSFDFIKKIKKVEKKLLEIRVYGNNWGIACNFIHFLDLINYFNNETNYSLVQNNLKKIYKTKRSGYYDFYGNLSFKTKRNTKIYFESKKGKISLKIELLFSNKIYSIDMINNKIIKKNLLKNNEKLLTGKIPYVSDLASKFAKKIYKNKFNELPNLRVSCLLHTPILKIFCKSFYTFKKKKPKNYCPIT
jgi:hypothetical protein